MGVVNKKLNATLSTQLIARIGDRVQGSLKKDVIALKQVVFLHRIDFPLVGNSTILYIDIDNNQIYIWKDNEYQLVSGDLPEITEINGGSASSVWDD